MIDAFPWPWPFGLHYGLRMKDKTITDSNVGFNGAIHMYRVDTVQNILSIIPGLGE